ncbi:MAG TPA: hypothetical protein V6D12_09925 [Candidatus Obscuribacterales bacterium]
MFYPLLTAFKREAPAESAFASSGASSFIRPATLGTRPLGLFGTESGDGLTKRLEVWDLPLTLVTIARYPGSNPFSTG